MSISEEDFAAACQSLFARWEAASSTNDWRGVRILQMYETTFLRITKDLARPQPSEDALAEATPAADHDDALATIKCSDYSDDTDSDHIVAKQEAHPSVLFDLVYSTSYQVPVLYFTFHNLPAGPTSSLEEVQSMMIPSLHRDPIRATGVVGGLSRAEHPLTGIPAYFVHPCRTAEAMQVLQEGKICTPEEYLCLWLGFIGASVGLNVPVEIAAAFVESATRLPG